jgi:hypothetical protein
MADQIILDDIVKLSRALVDAVTMDDSGMMVGTIWQGGNGGLLSNDTIKAADRLRRALAAHAGQPKSAALQRHATEAKSP